MANVILVAPMHGWSAPLDEVPDAVFSGRLLGDGIAIDPTEGVLYAPCDGEVITVPAQKHAITLRATAGAEILLHVGIDTVALNGEGFEVHVAAGARVKAGDRLISFDLDLLARRATSLLTPVVVTDGAPFTVVRRVSGLAVRAGEFLMEVAPVRSGARAVEVSEESGVVARVVVPLEHGIHARPAAKLASCVKAMAATVTVSVRGRSANARSATGLMSLGVRKGEEVTIHAVGPDAAAAVAALENAIRTATDHAAPVRATSSASPLAATVSAQAVIQTEAVMPRGRSDAAAATGPARAAVAGEDGASAAADSVVRGVTAAPGLAVGTAFHLARAEIVVSEKGGDVAHETARLEAARARVRCDLEAAIRRGDESTQSTGSPGTVSAGAATAGAEIVGAHLEFVDDPELIATATQAIAQGKSAGWAWRTALRASEDALSTLSDARMRERVDDLRDLEYQVLAALEGNGSSASRYELPDRAIVLATELLPSQFVALNTSRLAGICTAAGGPTSHVAVLAAALDIPMVVAAGPGVLDIQAGTRLILNADRGELHITPSASVIRAAEESEAARRTRRASERESAHLDCRTADGVRIEVFANVGSVADAEAAISLGAEGCGLLRTEFLFFDRSSPPDEPTQLAAYQSIVSKFATASRPVIIRTLDAGADKPLAYLNMPREENPALGVRGIRVSLQRPDLLRTQLRAILRVQPPGASRVLLPMVSEPGEVRAVRKMLDEVRRDLSHDANVQLGAMIETPASALLADQIAREADFLSIGTNDLTQYTLAMDRGHAALASRLDALHPAVLRLIATAARAGRAAGRIVAVCGGLASDPIAAPILIGLGVNELSAVPSVVPRLKSVIRNLTLGECEALARRTLEADSAADVRKLAASSEVQS